MSRSARPPSPRPNRRVFLFGALAAGAALATPAWARAARRSPNAKVRLAVVGCGGMGGADLKELAKHAMVEVAALCDVDRKTLASQGEKFADAARYTDYRELFSGDLSKFDAVLCSTPDHNHAAVLMRALRAGKHVYGQKPLTRTIFESRALREEAARRGVVTQMGIQRQATKGRRLAAAIMASGVVGKVSAVHIWTDRPAGWWPQGNPRPEGSDPVPEHLDWDSWLGVAPKRDFKAKAYAPFAWRGVLDFGTGALGDMGCHFFDAPFECLGLKAPLSAKANVKDLTGDQWPVSETVAYEFAGTDKTSGPILPLTWYDGEERPKADVSKHLPPTFDGREYHKDGGVIFVGASATLVVPCNGTPTIYPEEAAAAFKDPGVEGYDHWFAWIDAILGEGKVAAGFDFSGPVTEAVLLGAVAGRRPGVRLEWDDGACAVKNDPEANAFVKPVYREGWRVEGLG